MKKIVVLALVLFVFMFAATTIAMATINILSINILDWTLSVKHIVPLGDPFPGGPPGILKGTGS